MAGINGGGFLLAVLSKLAADEIKEWLPKLSSLIVRVAALRLPPHERDRYQEEWEADLLEYPGGIVRTMRALGFIVAAQRMQVDGMATRFGLCWNTAYLAFQTVRVMLWMELVIARVHLSKATRGRISAPEHVNVAEWTNSGRKRWPTVLKTVASLPLFLFRVTLNL